MTKKSPKEEEKVTPPETTDEPKPEQPPELSEKDQKQVTSITKVIENKSIAPSDAFGKLTRGQVELIKRTVAKGASDDELKLFIQVCKGAQLNPFLRQVHFVKRWNSKLGAEEGAIQVGIDGFRAIAEDSRQYAGNDDPIYDGDHEIEVSTAKETKKVTVPGKATVTVYKLMDGQRFPFTATARWTEYYPGPKQGYMWHKMPYNQLGKCAEALALRKAFPKLLSGMYVAEEMDQIRTETVEAQKQKSGAERIKEAISRMDGDAVNEYWTKINASEKYTADQKKEIKKMVDERLVAFAKELDDIAKK